MNILMLMFVAFMPVASGYMGEYGEVGLAEEAHAIQACERRDEGRTDRGRYDCRSALRVPLRS
jgi:hypothetical protein